MINLLVPITENVEKFECFIKNVKDKLDKDINILVAITKKLSKTLKIEKNVASVSVYADGSNVEQMINSLHSSKLKKGKIMVARRPLTDEEFEKLSTSEKDIAVLKRKRSKFVTKFKNLMTRLIKKFFAFTYFEDISAICYKENIFNLLSVCGNFSMATRVNRYVGLEIEEVETHEKQVKKIYSRTKNILKLFAGALFLTACVAGIVCISIFCKINPLFILLFLIMGFLGVAVFSTVLLNFTRTLAVGHLRWGKAESVSES